MRADSAAGRIPAEPLVDGVLILVAAAVLLTPGVLTDIAGFVCLIPPCRRWVRRGLLRRFEHAVRERRVGVAVDFGEAASPFSRPPMKIVTPRGPVERDRKDLL